MRTTLRIDDDLLRDLKSRAAEKQISLNKLLNELLRQALAARPSKVRPYREKVFSLGPPQVPLEKALAMAAGEEDEEILRKLAARK